MAKLPEGRQPLLWKDMPFAERPKAHPSTERLEIDKLKERVAELEARIAKADALAEALEAMLSHSCVADAGYDMKDAEDHAAERLARIALAAYREGSDT